MYKTTIEQFAQEAYELRDRIHREPELAFEEVKTSQKVRDFLDRHGIEYRYPIAKTGVLATIQGKYPGKTILLRADMDALPMQENKEAYNASLIDGKMHACGHDGHTAGLCLSAAVLNHHKEELHGTIKFMFQPAEEAIGGAYPMIQEGILEGVDMAFGAHLWGPGLEGTVAYKSGPLMASPDGFTIKVKGKGGHGSKPQASVDPVVTAAHVIVGMQSVVSRLNDPLEPLVVTFGKIHGGTAPNIIPDEVVMEGTVRTLNEDLRAKIPNQMKQVAEGIASAYGANIDLDFQLAYPVLVNDAKATSIVERSLRSFLDPSKIIQLKQPDMGGEDFAYIAQRVPSCFFYVGISKDEDHLISHHHCDFNFDNHNLLLLSEALITSALTALE